MATENVRRVIAMENRQCLKCMAEYFCEEEKMGFEYCDCKCSRGIGDQLDDDVVVRNAYKGQHVLIPYEFDLMFLYISCST